MMVTSHISCPALSRNNMDSIISINHEHEDSLTEIYNSSCESCSQCSNNHQSCQSNSNSILDEKCSHCSSVGHSSLTTDSRASSINYHNEQHYNHCSDQSSWKEDLKSTSTCSNNIVCRDYHNSKKKKLHHDFIHNNAIPDDKMTIKSLTSSKDYNNKRRKTRCCFCCFRNNTTSRMVVFFIFALCVLGAIAAFFCWPRTPRVSMGGGADSVNGIPPDWWAGERSPIPSQDNTALPARPSLRATWQINVTLDNRDNWIPTQIRSLEFVMMDSLTLAKFAWASTSNMILQPGTISPISLTFNVNYQAPDNMDPTFQNLYAACGPLKKSTDQRPALNVLLKVHFHIFGIIWTPIVTATPYTGGILCPIK